MIETLVAPVWAFGSAVVELGWAIFAAPLRLLAPLLAAAPPLLVVSVAVLVAVLVLGLAVARWFR